VSRWVGCSAVGADGLRENALGRDDKRREEAMVVRWCETWKWLGVRMFGWCTESRIYDGIQGCLRSRGSQSICPRPEARRIFDAGVEADHGHGEILLELGGVEYGGCGGGVSYECVGKR